MMKKFLSLGLAALLALSLAACGGTYSAGGSTVNSAQSQAGSLSGTASLDLTADPAAYLEGKKVGVQQGTIGDTFVSNLECTPVQFTKYADAVSALEQGKVDVVVLDKQSAAAFMGQKQQLAVFETPLSSKEFGIAIKKGNTQLTEQFNQAIAQLREEGTLDSILEYYLNGDTTKGYTTPDGTKYPNGKLVMATNATYPPYEYLDGEEIVGIDPDIAKAICDKLGYELVIQDMEFDAVLAAVNSGKADFGASTLTITEERLKNVDFTDGYAESVLVCMVAAQ